MSSRLRSRRRRGGFTLMEVLLVVAILIILAGLATVAIRQAYNNARVSATKLNAKSIAQSIDTYYLGLGQLPPSLEALIAMPDGLAVPEKWQGPYLKTENNRLPVDSWNREFIYEVDPQTEEFIVYSVGPDGQANTQDDIRN
jgi:general secretion pathway protein G